MIAIAFVLAMLGATPDCLPITEETLIMFCPEIPVCCIEFNR